MTKGWRQIPFEECLEKVTYTRKIQRADFLDDGPYPIVSQEEGLINGYWRNAEDLYKIAHPVVIFGDHTRVLKYIDFDFVLGADGVKVLQPKQFLLPRFFFYQMQSADINSIGYARHYRLLKELKIQFPPLAEQERIVKDLDQAFAGIAACKANTEKNLQNANALFESHLDSIFSKQGEGWTEKAMSDVCDITSTLVDPRKKEFLDLTHVGAANIMSRVGTLINLKTAREERLISGKFLFNESMVLYSKIRPYLMKVARPNFSGLCSADMYPLTPRNDVITRDFLFHMLLSKNFTDHAILGSARAGMPKVNREHIFGYKFWLPSMRLQKELAQNLDMLREETLRIIDLFEKKIVALDGLRASILHQTFSGKL